VRKDYKIAIQDMLDSIDFIEAAVLDRTVADYESNTMFRLAIQRSVEIISEASRAIPQEYKDLQHQVDWRALRDFGNVLRHGYYTIEQDIIWNVVTNRLVALKTALLAILAQ
jgi:uncharacterized protein with HEPN domain